MGGRWGRKFIDNRNWPECNERLVARGEYLLDFDFVKEGWRNELNEMNKNKAGRPFEFPNSLIELQAVWHAKCLPFRMIEGMTKRLCKIAALPAYNHYSTVNRRVNKLDIRLEIPEGESLALFSDGTGLQAVNGGEYLREKYGKKNRRWVQIIILGDARTKAPVSFEVNLIQGSEADSTKKQVKKLKKRGVDIESLGGDGSMDQMELWNLLEKEGIRPVIKPDANARDDTENRLRNEAVKERNEIGYKKWAKKNHYGLKWPATEGIFSAIKRIFGEQLAATSEKGMLQEAACKIWAYQRIKRYGEA